MPAPRIRTIIINSEQRDALVTFWCGFLRTEVQFSDGGITWLKPTVEGGVNVGIQQVHAKVASHTETHLDIEVDDLDGEQANIVELGGTLVALHRMDNGFEWRVMSDPDGNEFCIFVHG